MIPKTGWTCSCGAKNNDEYVFCMKCGNSKIHNQENENEAWECSCGAVNNAEYAFCMKCGNIRPVVSLEKKQDKGSEKAVEISEAVTQKTNNIPKQTGSTIQPAAINRNFTYATENISKTDKDVDDKDVFVDGIDIFTSRWLCKCGCVNKYSFLPDGNIEGMKCSNCNAQCEAEELLTEILKYRELVIPVPDAPPEFCLPSRLQDSIKTNLSILGLIIQAAIIITVICFAVHKGSLMYDLFCYKEGYIENYSKNVTNKEAFESYFENCSWDVYEMKEDNRKYTVFEFTGFISNDHEVIIKYRNNQKSKGGTATAYEFLIDGNKLSEYEMSALLDEIYGVGYSENEYSDEYSDGYYDYYQ